MPTPASLMTSNQSVDTLFSSQREGIHSQSLLLPRSTSNRSRLLSTNRTTRSGTHYALSQRLGHVHGSVGRFCPDPEVLTGLARHRSESVGPSPAAVPRSWRRSRCVGDASLAATYAEIGHSRSLT